MSLHSCVPNILFLKEETKNPQVTTFSWCAFPHKLIVVVEVRSTSWHKYAHSTSKQAHCYMIREVKVTAARRTFEWNELRYICVWSRPQDSPEIILIGERGARSRSNRPEQVDKVSAMVRLSVSIQSRFESIWALLQGWRSLAREVGGRDSEHKQRADQT
jgi:hypothetical protein